MPDEYLMVTPAYPPRIGGVERHVFELHRALRGLGVRGRVIVLDRDPAPADVDPNVVRIAARPIPGVPFSRRARTAAALLPHLARARRAALHFHDFGTLHPFLPMLRGLGLLDRTFLTFHGWEGVFPPDPRVIRRRRRCAASVRGTFSVGAFIPRWYGTPGDDPIYGGADVARFGAPAPAWTDLPPRVAYIGRLEEDTGVLELARAVAARRDRPVPLHVFGAGRLRDEIAAIGGERIVLHGPIADPLPVLQAFPIVFASGYLSILEAWCARRVVFAFHDNPLRRDYLELHPHAKSLVVCATAADVSRGLDACVDRPAEVEAAAAPGWEWARQQTWEALARRHLALWGIER